MTQEGYLQTLPLDDVRAVYRIILEVCELGATRTGGVPTCSADCWRCLMQEWPVGM